ITEAAGQRQMIVAGTKSIYAVDPETGKQLWKEDFAVDNGCIVMTPVRSGEHLFVGGYNGKSMVLKLKPDKPGADVVWKNKKGLGISPISVQPFLQDDVLYGYDDSGNMYAVELPSGKRLWEGEGPVAKEPQGSETAFIVKNGERF